MVNRVYRSYVDFGMDEAHANIPDLKHDFQIKIRPIHDSGIVIR